MKAGSIESIAYMFFQLADEILHALPCTGLLDWAWRVDFCQWAHRHDFLNEHVYTEHPPYTPAIDYAFSVTAITDEVSESSGSKNIFVFGEDGKNPSTFTN